MPSGRSATRAEFGHFVPPTVPTHPAELALLRARILWINLLTVLAASTVTFWAIEADKLIRDRLHERERVDNDVLPRRRCRS